MTFLKNLTVGLLSFLLFLSLTVFGLAFMLKGTALNPDFVTSEMDRLEVTSLLEEFLYIEPTPELPDLDETIHDAVSNIEPLVKEELGSVIHSTYDYLLGKTQQSEVASILRSTFFNADFVASLVDNIDITPLVAPLIAQQFTEAIPIEIENLDEYITDAVSAAEPALKKQLVAVSEPVFGYLLMETHTLEATISLDEIKESLRDSLLQVFLDSPPPELAVVPRDQRESFFNLIYQEFAGLIPSEYPLDENFISKEMPGDIAAGIASVEEALKEARRYVEIFQLYYTFLIVFMVLLVLGIVLIIRNVKDITRHLGIPLLTYGVVEYAGIWLAKYFTPGQLPALGIPPNLEVWMFQFIDNILKPLEVFSIGLLIGGAALTIISFVYRRD
ncbi:hypothetical protein ACFLVC_00460 [Chloroflexota bacterium]